MKRSFLYGRSVFFLVSVLLISVLCMACGSASGSRLPYAAAGLTERQAAAFLLDRIGFGPRPGEVDRVLAKGLERWLDEQLKGDLPDSALQARLGDLPIWTMSTREIASTYINYGTVLGEARREGYIPKDNVGMTAEQIRAKAEEYGRMKGYRPENEMIEGLERQKLLRAVYGENRLVEVLTDFWFNHFNVNLHHGSARTYIFSYERDAIRPYVLGKFLSLVRATAAHPAMLHYLDNAQSTAAPTKPGARGGINENYARELMELHTLGVDGGYNQQDVLAAARVLTGWSVEPRGDFVFRPERHDNSPVTVMGESFAAGGQVEGERLLLFLSRHRATARHIAEKMAARFVQDDPPKQLVDRLAKVFLETDGDLRLIMKALLESTEFWQASARRDKIKTPFALAVSSIRAVGAEVETPQNIINWIARMGQPLYACLPPTGYSDRGERLLNAGTLVARMNFTTALVRGNVRGIKMPSPLPDPTQLLPWRDVAQIIKTAGSSVLAVQSEVLLGSPEFQRY